MMMYVIEHPERCIIAYDDKGIDFSGEVVEIQLGDKEVRLFDHVFGEIALQE